MTFTMIHNTVRSISSTQRYFYILLAKDDVQWPSTGAMPFELKSLPFSTWLNAIDLHWSPRWGPNSLGLEAAGLCCWNTSELHRHRLKDLGTSWNAQRHCWTLQIVLSVHGNITICNRDAICSIPWKVDGTIWRISKCFRKKFAATLTDFKFSNQRRVLVGNWSDMCQNILKETQRIS